MSAYEDVLAELGYEASEDLATAIKSNADDPETGEGSLSHNGEYKVEGAWKKGNVTVHLERNTAPEDQGDDMTAVVTHPPLLVVKKSDVVVAGVRPRDPEALKAVLTDLG